MVADGVEVSTLALDMITANPGNPGRTAMLNSETKGTSTKDARTTLMVLCRSGQRNS